MLSAFLDGSDRSARAIFRIAWARSKLYIRALMNKWIPKKHKNTEVENYWKEARPSWIIIQIRCARFPEKVLFEHRSGKVLKGLTLVTIYSNCLQWISNSAIPNLRPDAMITWCFGPFHLLYSATMFCPINVATLLSGANWLVNAFFVFWFQSVKLVTEM
jgi:hypothetical protein